MDGRSSGRTLEVLTAELLRGVAMSMTASRPFNASNLLVRRETDLSRLLAWLLDPAADHGAGATHLTYFLQTLGLEEPVDIGRSRIELEATRRSGGSVVGRVDIQVAHPDMLLLIENKPTAPFGDRQVQRYLNSLPSSCGLEAVVVLLGHGWDPASVAALHGDPRVVAARLGVEVRDWVARCARAAFPGRIREFIEMVHEDLDVRHGGTGGATMKGTIEAMVAGPESVAAAVAVLEARDAFHRRFAREFEARVAEAAARAGLVRIFRHPEEAPLFGGVRHGMLRLDVGQPEFDVVLEADGTGFRDVSFSVCSRRRIARLRAVHGELRERMVAAFGAGGEGEAAGWYVWWDSLDGLHPTGRAPVEGPARWAWAADPSQDGLAARFVSRALDIRQILLSGTA